MRLANISISALFDAIQKSGLYTAEVLVTTTQEILRKIKSTSDDIYEGLSKPYVG